MYTRAVFFQGSLSQEQLKTFRKKVSDELAPAIKCLPRCKSVQLLWAKEKDPTAPEIILTIHHTYDNKHDMMLALESKERTISQKIGTDILNTYPISVHHMNFESCQLD